MQRRGLVLIVASLALAALPLERARGGGPAREMIVCYPGKPGNPKAAVNVMKTLTDYLEDKAGFERDSLHATYFNEEKPAVDFIKEKRPAFGILSVGIYLKWRKEGQKFNVIAQSERREQMTEKYHVLVPESSARKSLADLKGATIVSDHLQDGEFATKIVFAGALDASKDVAVVSTRDPLRAMKMCARKKPMSDGRGIDALVLDDDQVQGMKDLPEFKALREVFASRPLPTPPVVAFAENAAAGDSDKLKAAFLGMAKDPQGKAILESLLATGFNPVAPEAYATVEKEY